MEELSLSSLLSLASFEPNTPEEIETLNLCKKNTFYTFRNYAILGGIGTGFIGALHHSRFSRTGRVLNILMGLFMGGLWGVIQSNK